MERARRSRGDGGVRVVVCITRCVDGCGGDRAASFMIACFLRSRNAPATPLERDMYFVTVLGLLVLDFFVASIFNLANYAAVARILA